MILQVAEEFPATLPPLGRLQVAVSPVHFVHYVLDAIQVASLAKNRGKRPRADRFQMELFHPKTWPKINGVSLGLFFHSHKLRYNMLQHTLNFLAGALGLPS